MNQVKQKNSIIKMAEQSIQNLQAIRRTLLEVGAKDRELKWAVGSLYIVLVNALLSIIEETFEQGQADGTADARKDLQAILDSFTSFIETMITGE